jgi:UDPglucose--hexose-1-phosphate uridylyltransferase
VDIPENACGVLFRAIRQGRCRTGEILQTVLAKVHGMLANPPSTLSSAHLVRRKRMRRIFIECISIVPRVNKRAGFELGTGMYINPSSPESCAQALREFGVPAG